MRGVGVGTSRRSAGNERRAPGDACWCSASAHTTAAAAGYAREAACRPSPAQYTLLALYGTIWERCTPSSSRYCKGAAWRRCAHARRAGQQQVQRAAGRALVAPSLAAPSLLPGTAGRQPFAARPSPATPLAHLRLVRLAPGQQLDVRRQPPALHQQRNPAGQGSERVGCKARRCHWHAATQLIECRQRAPRDPHARWESGGPPWTHLGSASSTKW